MKFSILHLSDIHSSNNKDSIFEKEEKIFSAIKNKLRHVSYLFIAITGDIAFSGKKQEYIIAKKLLISLQKKLLDYNQNLKIEFIIVPGNHDCDFSNIDGEVFRKMTIEGLLNKTLDIKNILPAHIDECVKVQKEFFDFQSNLENKKAIVEEISNSIFKRYEFKIENNIIAFNLYNLSWMSQKYEEQAKIYYPCFSFKEKLLERSCSSGVNISLYHHPLHWLNHTNIKNLKELINITSKIVLSGHEHFGDNYQEAHEKSGNTQYIESPALQTKNPHESGFRLIEIDLSGGGEKIFELQWDKDTLAYRETEQSKHIDFNTNVNLFELDESYFEKINSAGAQISHPYKPDIKLEDIFIYQDLKAITDGDLKIVKNASTFKNMENISKIFIFGAETSGKTSLSYMLQMTHKRGGKIPIIINGKNINVKINDNARIEKLVERAFEKQYKASDLAKFKQEDIQNVLIIIDDFNECTLNNAYKTNFLETLEKAYSNIIIFAHESFELEALNDENLVPVLKNYEYYSINQFGFIQRDRLVKQWVSLGREGIIDHKELHQIVLEKTKIINTTIGYNIVPSYPIFLLTLLQAMEINSASELVRSSYGHYYSFLITRAFEKNKIDKDDHVLYYTYISMLAFQCFSNSQYSLEEHELVMFHEEFKREKRITNPYDKIKDKLIASKILSEDSGTYKFAYDYAYYYFVALHLSENIDDPKVIEIIKRLVQQLHITAYSNIIMFLTHHTNKKFILTLLLNEAHDLFSEIEEFALSKEELLKVNEFMTTQDKRIVVEDKSIEETRETYLKHKEEVEENKMRDHDARGGLELEKCESISKMDLFSKLNFAFKLINIVGEIIKTYHVSFSGSEQAIIIREIYGLLLRATNIFVSNFEEHHDLIIEAIEEHIEKKGYVTQDRIKATSQQMVFNILTKLSEGFMSKLAKSVASKKLALIFEDIRREESNNNAIKMISTAIDLDFPKGLNDEKIIEQYKSLDGNFLAQATLKRLVIDHMYMFHVDYNKKDRIMEKLDIHKNNNVKMIAKKHAEAQKITFIS